MREFETGATRDSDEDKYDYEGFLNPLVIEAFGEYMHRHRFQRDGKVRASDNWQKGIPIDAYMKSLLRHVHALWMAHRGYLTKESWKESAMAIWFNTQGYTLEMLKKEQQELNTEPKWQQMDLSKWPAFGIPDGYYWCNLCEEIHPVI